MTNAIRPWAVGVVAAVAGALTAPAVASANAVLDWNQYGEQAIARDAMERRQPDLGVLNRAMLAGAVYDAVNAIDGRYQPYLVKPHARRWYSIDAATATAAYRTAIGVAPGQQAALEPLYRQSLAAIADGPAKSGGIRVGEKAAEAMLVARENDGRGGPWDWDSYIGDEPGEWRPTPPNFRLDTTPWLGNVKPFLLERAEQLRTRGPSSLTSDAYTEQFNEVKEYGAKTDSRRSAEQTDIALFWNRPEGDVTVMLARSQRLGTTDTARLLAMVRLAGADSQIACRNDKYYWTWWRPPTAIHEAETDGNPDTDDDDDWESLIDSPPYPDHPAGHTCGSAANYGALRNFFGTDRMSFTFTSASSGTTRSFTSFSQALDEVIDSRVWAGVHFRAAEVQGARLGAEVARWERRHYFKPAS